MPGLRRRLQDVLDRRAIGEDELVALLRLDPLAVVRGLRAASTLVFRRANALPTVRDIVRSLGPTLSKRLFLEPRVEVHECEHLRDLWQHAIATAHAAEELATRTGLLEPEVAYLVGLLHDLPEWLRHLGQQDEDSAASGTQPTDWILNWQLPAPFVSLMLAIDMGDKPTSAEDPPDPAGLILGAELLAELAGFGHARSDDDIDAGSTLTIEPSELVVAEQLDRKVAESLAEFGFDQTEQPRRRATETCDLAPEISRSNLDEIVVSILGCTRSESYRGIITVLTAAAVRYGGYDRAFYAKWNDETATLTLRSKADSSARRMVRTQLEVDAEEATRLRTALETQTPQHLTLAANHSNGLLGMLSTDELLAIPLNCEFETPAFLLLDRSVTLTPIDLSSDMTMATMLGMTGSLLIQNLLLRRRRQRAQKFALTDPLTRLFNRRMGMHALEQAIARTERDDRPLTVLMCDLDHFKRLNDTLGHVSGDAALRATADVLRHSVRKSDTVCRYGGEEFLVVLPDTTPDDATVLAARMFTAVHARGEELGLPITISIGLTSHRAGDTMEAMLIRADHALYASKGHGRNRFSADVDVDDPPSAPEGASQQADTPSALRSTQDLADDPLPRGPESAKPDSLDLPKDP